MAHEMLLSALTLSVGVDRDMFKIRKDIDNAARIRMNLFGLFTNEYVPEVEKALSDDAREGNKVTLDLRNVTFVDRQAMVFLTWAKLKNVRIENTPSYVMRWIEQEAQNRRFESE